jgi:hypothetical protein
LKNLFTEAGLVENNAIRLLLKKGSDEKTGGLTQEIKNAFNFVFHSKSSFLSLHMPWLCHYFPAVKGTFPGLFGQS